MPGQHALLSPSSAHRWLNCPPSAKLCAAQEDTTSVYAQQGTDAHELCQYKLKKALGLDTKDPTENLTYYKSLLVGKAVPTKLNLTLDGLSKAKISVLNFIFKYPLFIIFVSQTMISFCR